MWILVHELPLTGSYGHFYPFECSLKMQSRPYARPWTWAWVWPCSFQTKVSTSPLIGGHLAAVCSRSFPISCSAFRQLLHTVRSLWNCLSYLAFLAALHHFLPSFLVWAGKTFSPTPIRACSLSQPWTLPLFPFPSVLPLRLCYCIL